MKCFDELLEIADRLLGPAGCPWDKKQTFQSLRPFLLEEAHEVLEAVDHKDIQALIEELGDLFFIIVFYIKLGEKDNLFSAKDVIGRLIAKMIRRHPHIFEEKKMHTADEVLAQWEAIKKGEKRTSGLIPKSLNVLSRAQKILEVMERKKIASPKLKQQKRSLEEKMGDAIIELVKESREKEIDAESAVRVALKKYEACLTKPVS